MTGLSYAIMTFTSGLNPPSHRRLGTLFRTPTPSRSHILTHLENYVKVLDQRWGGGYGPPPISVGGIRNRATVADLQNLLNCVCRGRVCLQTRTLTPYPHKVTQSEAASSKYLRSDAEVSCYELPHSNNQPWRETPSP